jgi:dCTP deaminase
VLLPDHLIRDYLANGTIDITPFDPAAVRPASVDLRLGPVLKIEDRNVEGGWREHDLRDSNDYRLYHGDFVLAATLERVTLPDTLAGILAGKSSRAREGIQIEAAGYVDPGFDGELTLEVTRFRRGESRLTLGMPICQIRFEMLLAPAETPYGSDRTSHYQHSIGPVTSRTEVAR